jgi:hypothetical protein
LQNVEELENIPSLVNKDLFYISRLMAMTFSKEEFLEPSVSGQTSENPKNNKVTDISLSDLKKKIVEKMFCLHISKDHLGWHETRLKNVNQHKISKKYKTRKR